MLNSSDYAKNYASTIGKNLFTVQCMLIYQNVVLLPGHAVSFTQAIR